MILPDDIRNPLKPGATFFCEDCRVDGECLDYKPQWFCSKVVESVVLDSHVFELSSVSQDVSSLVKSLYIHLYNIHQYPLHWYFTLSGKRRFFCKCFTIATWKAQAWGVDRWCLVAIKLALPLRFFVWKLRALGSWDVLGCLGASEVNWNVWNVGLKVMIGTVEFWDKRILDDGVDGV